MALRRYHRTFPLILATLLASTLALGCSTSPAQQTDRNGIPVGPVSAQRIARQPLSHLFYPGSKPFYRLDAGSPETRGSGPAYAGAILTSSATGAQIYAWYIKTLRNAGWSFITDNGCADIQPSCPQFGHNRHGKREVLFLAIDDPLELPSVIGKKPPPACTVYEVRYQLFPPGGIRIPGRLMFDGGHHCWWTGRSWHKPADVP